MNFKRLLIVPDRESIDLSIKLANDYDCGFEYNDFFSPDILDNKEKCDNIIKLYKKQTDLPEYCTLHGAFLDVTVFSQDSKILEVSDCRVEQSIAIAREIGAGAIVFHTNYIANFKQKNYREDWLKTNVKYWSEKCHKYQDISIYIENMFDDDYELILKLAENMADVDNFGICFDYAHACVFGHVDKINEWCEKLGPYIRHVHINDNDFESDSHQQIGTGKIDWDSFKDNHKKYFQGASVLVEMNGIDKIKASLEYLKAL